ncbi:putative glycoside hydrolase family 15 protein [Saccharothrix sp.]|uniref:putative glycoside hydrolase family 15 protein n=1 Tax=Saccharothrix sp. TaxID=1873460 RepID=UPI0028127E51|nr:putative glycoside hydrolase family 15 protein [Saccharothrix sp.]
MPKQPLIRGRRWRVAARAGLAAVVLAGSAWLPSSAGPWVAEPEGESTPLPADPAPLAPPPKPLAPCAWWYGIGEPPTYADLKFAAQHYDLVVLNATETAAMRRLRKLNPKIKILVYKDFSSTRNYPGAVDGGKDAPYLPSGVGYIAAQKNHPEWFAVDTADRHIEWKGYPLHWQMTVWTESYQKAWADAVTAEVVREGWDGVLADNDFSSLRYYSSAVLKGTADAAATDRLIRDGLDRFLQVAGDSLAQAGKMLIPNVSESHLTPGRWSAHSRYSGAMEENFGLRENTGGGELLTFRGNEFKELRAQAALGESWLLLVTKTHSVREERVGYATAALLAGPYTCWHGASTQDYQDPDWSAYQDSGLGEAVESANQLANGAWTRTFTNGWVAVNPTGKSVKVTPPPGLTTIEGTPVTGAVELPGADAAVLVKPPAPATTSQTTTTTTTTTTPTTTTTATTTPSPRTTTTTTATITTKTTTTTVTTTPPPPTPALPPPPGRLTPGR